MQTDIKQSLIDMIDSAFTYGGAEKNTDNFKTYILPYKKEMDEKQFWEIYRKRVAFLKKFATVRLNVYTDNEGLTYNSLDINEKEK